MRLLHSVLCLLCLQSVSLAAQLPRVVVSADGSSFALATGEAFTPWGFNYDHEGDGQLLEDYWRDQWPTVVEAFGEMKHLGANVVRIHLQFGKFMESPSQPRQSELDQLSKLLKLAESKGLYLDLTGLGCYHKADVPPWYDELDQAARWNAQAVFWEAIAKTCAGSPAVFCYDLMNEPVVGSGKRRDDWLGPGFGGKHFVQFITLQTKDRPRHEVALQWVRKLKAAIRRHDKKTLVTVGLVPWSLKRPKKLYSGFDPKVIAGELDFVAMHIYPESGKLEEAIETVRGFAATGKPVVIEEIFTLKCNGEELDAFIDRSREVAQGWIGFYWGQTPDSYRPPKTIPEALTLSWLELFVRKTSEVVNSPPRFQDVKCDGVYAHHLQGVCTDETDAIFWSFTTTLVRTDRTGKVLNKVAVGNHHGDLCYHNGRLYVAVNFGKFNDPAGNADSWVYVYDCKDLKLLAKHKTPELFYGAGGIGFRGGRFYVVGGLPGSLKENYVYEYDAAFRFVKRHVIASGQTFLGIQTAAFAHGKWWFGCYGEPKILLVTDENFKLLGRHEFDCSLGIVRAEHGKLLSASGVCSNKGCDGKLRLVSPDKSSGLK